MFVVFVTATVHFTDIAVCSWHATLLVPQVRECLVADSIRLDESPRLVMRPPVRDILPTLADNASRRANENHTT